jgi:hypothetical protein
MNEYLWIQTLSKTFSQLHLLLDVGRRMSFQQTLDFHKEGSNVSPLLVLLELAKVVLQVFVQGGSVPNQF